MTHADGEVIGSGKAQIMPARHYANPVEVLAQILHRTVDRMIVHQQHLGFDSLQRLVERVAQGGVKEVILALSSTMEGDTTNFFISRKLASFPVSLSVIARGISVGDELEYTDEVTLGRSILNRTPFAQ
jgi:recombinational DNA repair protein RecR